MSSSIHSKLTCQVDDDECCIILNELNVSSSLLFFRSSPSSSKRTESNNNYPLFSISKSIRTQIYTDIYISSCFACNQSKA